MISEKILNEMDNNVNEQKSINKELSLKINSLESQLSISNDKLSSIEKLLEQLLVGTHDISRELK